MKHVLLFVLVISFVSCHKEEVKDYCLEEFIESMSITFSEVYPEDCLTAFEMFECDGGVYFLGCNACAICESIPLHCNGEYLHKVLSSQEEYFAYIQNSQFVKVVGYIE